VKCCWLLGACLLLPTEALAQQPVPAPETAASQWSPSSSPPEAIAIQGESSGQAVPVATTGVTGPVFRSSVDLVALNVIVTDLRQRFVAGLSATDFAVFEDGVRQDVSFFAASEVPIDIALLLDTSASMSDKMAVMQRAALGFLGTLRPNDRAMVVDIKDATRVLHGLQSNESDLESAVRMTRAGGGTGLYNGLYLTFKELVKSRAGNNAGVRRQAIVVLSDGQDTSSLMSFDDVMDVAKQSGIATYTITLRSPRLSAFEQARGQRYFSQSEFAMRTLAQETGGQAFFPLDIGELDGVYASIARELASQYALGYTPKTVRADGRFRRIVVQVPASPEMRIRTRSGYTPRRTAGALE
jgi:Ca-activated chloride channel homolog